MDSDGNIYLFKNHPDPEAFIAELDLVVIPDDELAKVTNMSHPDRRKWYSENKNSC